MSSGITSLQPLSYGGQLPTEIILHIISQLDHKLDRKTLSTCSLINSSTREDAQKYLFTSIKLVTIFKREKHPFLLEAICHNITESAIETIIKSARLASYVRRLEIQLHNALASDATSTDTEEAFPYVLRRFQHLQELSLYSNMIWSRLNETTTHSIHGLLKSNPLRTVYLRGNHAIPLEIMYDCSELRQLTVWAMTSLKEEGPADPTRSSIPLSSLMIRCPRDTEGLLTMSSILEHVQSPTCPLTLSSLTNFVVHQPIERARFIFLISTALSLCSSTLTHLTFPIPRSSGVYQLAATATSSEINNSFPVLDLSSLSNLRDLNIVNGVVKSSWVKDSEDSAQEKTTSCCTWLGAVLSTLPRQCQNGDFHLKLKLRVSNVSAQGVGSIPWKNFVDPVVVLKDRHKQSRAPSMLLNNKPYSKSTIAALAIPERTQSTLQALQENPELKRLGAQMSVEGINVTDNLPGRFAISMNW